MSIQLFVFLEKILFLKNKSLGENFSISENNRISVEEAQVLLRYLDVAETTIPFSQPTSLKILFSIIEINNFGLLT
jgi:hypothetical protein